MMGQAGRLTSHYLVVFVFLTLTLVKSILLWMVGFEPTTQKTHGLSTTPFVQVLVGY